MAATALAIAAPQVHAQSWYTHLAPEVSGATGSGSAFFSLTGTMLSISANWTGLSGTTTVAHIHCCTAVAGTGTIGVAVTPGTLPGFPTGVTSGTYGFIVDLSLASSFTTGFVNNFGGGTLPGAQAALVTAFESGNAYFNVHSNRFPAGEVRGFITTVPEPSSVILMAAGLLALAIPVARRRRSN